jgi:hypothetical protein
MHRGYYRRVGTLEAALIYIEVGIFVVVCYDSRPIPISNLR